MVFFSCAIACWKSHQPCFPCAWAFLTVIYCCNDELSQSTWYHSNIILRSDISLPHLMKFHWKIDFANVIWVGYTLMRDITLGEVRVMIYPQSRLLSVIVSRKLPSQIFYMDGLVTDCIASVASALDILQSWTKPSIRIIKACLLWSFKTTCSQNIKVPFANLIDSFHFCFCSMII